MFRVPPAQILDFRVQQVLLYIYRNVGWPKYNLGHPNKIYKGMIDYRRHLRFLSYHGTFSLAHA